MIVKEGLVEINERPIRIGQTVVANKVSKEYEGLKGVIREIRTGDDLYDNYFEEMPEQIIVDFEKPTGELLDTVLKRFMDIFDRNLDVDDLVLKDIICIIDELDF